VGGAAVPCWGLDGASADSDRVRTGYAPSTGALVAPLGARIREVSRQRSIVFKDEPKGVRFRRHDNLSRMEETYEPQIRIGIR
jgi:hypothetical protein